MVGLGGGSSAEREGQGEERYGPGVCGEPLGLKVSRRRGLEVRDNYKTGCKDANACSGKANAEECPLSKVVTWEEVGSTTDYKNRKRKKEKGPEPGLPRAPNNAIVRRKKALAGVPTDPAPDPIFASEEVGARTDSTRVTHRKRAVGLLERSSDPRVD